MFSCGLSRRLRCCTPFDKLVRVHHHAEYFCLADNLGFVLAAAKGRSKTVGLLVALRKMFACTYRSAHSLAFRWIPSEVKIASEGSRYIGSDYDASNCLLARFAVTIPKKQGRVNPASGIAAGMLVARFWVGLIGEISASCDCADSRC